MSIKAPSAEALRAAALWLAASNGAVGDGASMEHVAR